MKIKSTPEDFIVNEEISIAPQKKGAYGLYSLEKKDEGTMEALEKISRVIKVPLHRFAYGGRKDKHAHSRQFITIHSPQKYRNIDEKIFRLTSLGRLDRPMGPDLITRNHFQITVRDLSGQKISGLKTRIPEISQDGFPNYFDNQRFGTFDPAQGFLAEKILHKHYNGALKIHLTRPQTADKTDQKNRKKIFWDRWGHWDDCLKIAQSPFEKYCFEHLKKNPKNFLDVLKMIPRHEITLYFSAFQSFLFNETLKRLLQKTMPSENLFEQKGICVPYLFWRRLKPDEKNFLITNPLSLAASSGLPEKEPLQSIVEGLYLERNLKPSLFNLKKIRTAYFKPTPRDLIGFAQDLKYSFSPDESKTNHQKLSLIFSLKRGAYATMLLKSLIPV